MSRYHSVKNGVNSVKNEPSVVKHKQTTQPHNVMTSWHDLAHTSHTCIRTSLSLYTMLPLLAGYTSVRQPVDTRADMRAPWHCSRVVGTREGSHAVGSREGSSIDTRCSRRPGG